MLNFSAISYIKGLLLIYLSNFIFTSSKWLKVDSFDYFQDTVSFNDQE